MQRLWAVTKFSLLMLSVGILPSVPQELLPLTLAILLVAAIAAPLLLRATAALSRATSVSPQNHQLHSNPYDFVQVSRPEAPGTPGTVRSRAPASVATAHV